MTRPAKNKPKSASVTARARALKASGKTRDEVVAALAAEGHRVSAGWVSGACKGPAPTATTEAPPARRGAPTSTLPVPDSPPADLLGILRRQVEELVGLARDAHEEGNVTGYGVLARAVNATAALVGKLEPPPPIDPNDAPDVQAAAQEARELLMAAVERAIARRVG